MRARNPDQRYRAVAVAADPPEHVCERALWDALHTATISDARVTWALEIFAEPFEREIFQAWLLARASDQDIEKWLRVPPDVTQVYRYLFFDVDVFRDELDLLAWVREFESEKKGTAYGAQLLRDAVQGGVEKLSWIFGHNTFVIDAETVKQRTMTDMYIRSLAGRGHGAASKEAQAALAHGNAALKAAQIVGHTTPSDMQAFLLKLRYRELTEPVTATVEKKEEILH